MRDLKPLNDIIILQIIAREAQVNPVFATAMPGPVVSEWGQGQSKQV